MNRFYDYRILECPKEKALQLDQFLSELIYHNYVGVDSSLRQMNNEYPEKGIIVLFLGDTDFLFLSGQNMQFLEEAPEGTGKVTFQMPEGWKYKGE